MLCLWFMLEFPLFGSSQETNVKEERIVRQRWRAFLFATDHRQILAAGMLTPSPNEAVAAEFLSFRIRSRDETLLAGLRRLPPAHVLVVTPERSTLARYWQFDGNPCTRALQSRLIHRRGMLRCSQQIRMRLGFFHACALTPNAQLTDAAEPHSVQHQVRHLESAAFLSTPAHPSFCS